MFNSHLYALQQKIVIQLYPKRSRAEKCRSKAFTLAAQAYGIAVSYILIFDSDKIELCLFSHLVCVCVCVGVSRVEIQQDMVVVIGENVDSIGLTTLIRKKVCNASLELVENVQ